VYSPSEHELNALTTRPPRHPTLIFPFLQTNITSQMWPSGGKGESEKTELSQLQRKSFLLVQNKVRRSMLHAFKFVGFKFCRFSQ